MSRNESSLLFSLNELRSLEVDRAAKERAEAVAEQQRREAEAARRRAEEAEQQRQKDALRAALVERDAQMALAQRAVERHAAMAAELAAIKAKLDAAERTLATPVIPDEPARSKPWTILNGLLAAACMGLLTTTIVFYGKPAVIIDRSVPVLTPVVVPAAAPPSVAAQPGDPPEDQTRGQTQARPKPAAVAPRPRPGTNASKAPQPDPSCDPLTDVLCGIEAKRLR